MTPEERDGARRTAQRLVDVNTAAHGGEPGWVWRAVLAYVPPGDVTAPPLMRVEVDGLVRIYDHRERKGPTLTIGPDDAERLAWALLAAVHAARTATTTTPTTGAAEGT